MPAPAGVDNGDIGAACTGANTDGGGALQGSCVDGEVCFELWAAVGPQCVGFCGDTSFDGGPCTGSALCEPLETEGGGTEDLCLPDCTVNGTDCPVAGLSCAPSTPGQFDEGVCVPSCAANSDCNSSEATSFTCSNGVCKCSRDSDCNTGGASGLECDTTSGSCYTPCTGPADTSCGAGCCAAQGSLDYCDAVAESFPVGSGAICAACTQGSDCTSGFCDTFFGAGFCDSLAYCTASDGTFSSCGNSVACNSANGDCACPINPIVDAGPTGVAICGSCTTAAECASGFCDTFFGTPGFCDTADLCNPAGGTNADCGVSVACNTSNGDCACAPNPIVDAGPPGEICASCTNDSDCHSNFCNLNNGNAAFCDVPDGCSAGDGQCSPGGVACNGNNGACACAANATGAVAICGACTQDSDCASGFCEPGLGYCDSYYICNDSGDPGTSCGGQVECNLTNGGCGCPDNPPPSSGNAPSCGPAVPGLQDGDLGAACTGFATDGGVLAGSCSQSAAAEFCYDLFGDGSDRCYAFCDPTTFACPGSSLCLNVGSSASPVDLCFADCQPTGAACPDRLTCEPLSPDLNETGYCFAGCAADADCNGANGTAFVCSAGLCKCTVDSDCTSGGSTDRCDVGSGVCYPACAGPGDTSCADGCCANSGTLNYCDQLE